MVKSSNWAPHTEQALAWSRLALWQ